MESLFYQDWFSNERWWFHATPKDDAYLTQTYGHLLHNCIIPPKCFDSIESHITYIIVHDQLPRHVYREHPPTEKTASIAKHLELAVAHADTIITNSFLKSLTSDQACFALLPYRHVNHHKSVFHAISLMWELLKDRPDDKRLKRFLKAAYSHAPMNQHELVTIHAPNASQILPTQRHHAHQRIGLDLFHNYQDIVCPTACYEPNLVTGTNIHSHCQKIPDTCPSATTPIIISLSGGVDSMILSYALAHTIHSNKLIAVHIDYGNRGTSEKEAEFVREWCSCLGISCVTRHINEIHRPTCMQYGLRAIYESYTRNVRYNTYKAGAQTHPSIVALGHNFNDGFENIISNVTHRTKYDNLLGMEETSNHDNDLTFWRPFLGVTKEQIYQYAHAHGIPYLYDSTVCWSQRGKIRDNIYPVVAEWNSKAFQGFYELSLHLTGMHEILDSLVTTYISQTSSQRIVTISSNFKAFLNPLFWRGYIHRLTNIHPSHASMSNFIERLRTKKSSKVILHKTLHVSIQVSPTTTQFHFECFSPLQLANP